MPDFCPFSTLHKPRTFFTETEATKSENKLPMDFIHHHRLPADIKVFLRGLTALLPKLNFMTLHYTYFITSILLFSVIFWGSTRPDQSIDYVDCLFMVTSAMTETGLNTINMSQLNIVQQVLLFMLMIGGSSIFVTY